MKYVKYVIKMVAFGCRSMMIATIFFLLPAFIGKKPMVVLSDSMKPTFTKGSLIYVEPTTYQDLREGDIVSFQDATIITHRIIEKKEDTKSVITKGDANSFADSEISAHLILGKVKESLHVPLIGYVLFAMQKEEVVLGMVLIMLLENVLSEYEEKKIIIKNPLY